MTWAALREEVIVEMGSLGGGLHWDSVEECLWMMVQNRAQRLHQYHLDHRRGNAWHRERDRKLKRFRLEKMSSLVVYTSTCATCGKRFAVTAKRVAQATRDSTHRFCDVRCAQVASNERRRRVEIGGVRDTISGWARRRGITPATVTKRLRRGWTMQQALGLKATVEVRCVSN